MYFCKRNYNYFKPVFIMKKFTLLLSFFLLSSLFAFGTPRRIILDNKGPIKNGTEYEIEASGTVTLEDGFQVEKGATFAVYPACF